MPIHRPLMSLALTETVGVLGSPGPGAAVSFRTEIGEVSVERAALITPTKSSPQPFSSSAMDADTFSPVSGRVRAETTVLLSRWRLKPEFNKCWSPFNIDLHVLIETDKAIDGT